VVFAVSRSQLRARANSDSDTATETQTQRHRTTQTQKRKGGVVTNLGMRDAVGGDLDPQRAAEAEDPQPLDHGLDRVFLDAILEVRWIAVPGFRRKRGFTKYFRLSPFQPWKTDEETVLGCVIPKRQREHCIAGSHISNMITKKK
jgi:hypothetical protein